MPGSFSLILQINAMQKNNDHLMNSEKKTQQPVLYGGQAIIEGVMIRGRNNAAIAIRKQSGEIVRHKLELNVLTKIPGRKIPFIRGFMVLLETLILGMKALTVSANESIESDDIDDFGKNEMGKLSITIMLIISFVFGVSLFFLTPLFISSLFERIVDNALIANILEGLIRLFLFIAYIWLIGKMGDVRRVFGYHGAEHMSVAAHEAGQHLTVENVRKFPEAHPRCGTSFLMTVVTVSILLFVLIPREPFWMLIGSRIVLIPLIATISYELIRYAGIHSDQFWIRLLTRPNLILQNLTTRPPDDQMLEVAIDAMTYALELDNTDSKNQG